MTQTSATRLELYCSLAEPQGRHSHQALLALVGSSHRHAVEHYILGKYLEAYEAELKWQLSEQGEYDNDWGLLFELEREHGIEIWEAHSTLIAVHEWPRWIATGKLSRLHEWGAAIPSGSALCTSSVVTRLMKWRTKG